jgi:Cd2+/Zn2+-exporting ATPase
MPAEQGSGRLKAAPTPDEAMGRRGRLQAAQTCGVCELHAEAVFRVDGMDCNDEVVILERRLKPLAGIEAVAADIVGQRLHVKYDAAKVSTSAIVEAVGPTGMRIWLEHEEPRASSADVHYRLVLTLLSGAATACGVAGQALGVDVSRVLFLAAVAIGGVYPARRALAAIRSRAVDINVLMVVAIAGAVALGDWFEAASVVCLFALAQWLEVRTLERARQAIRALVDLSPREALVLRDGIEQRLPVERVRVGDIVIVKPGDKIPVDGRVTVGQSDVNEAPMTGESLPVDKALGAEIYAGTINGRGALEVEVTRVGADTRLARITHLVEDAQSQRAPVQTFVDRFARIYTPAVVMLALLVAVLPPLLSGGESALWLYRALVLLVIACPCALVISTPVSIVAALSAAARHGVLVKGGAHLERLAGVKIVAFDKTGTLTRGVLQVTRVVCHGQAAMADVIRYAAAVESRSEHPVARAINARAQVLGLDIPAAAGFSSAPGLGASATVAGRQVTIGNARFFESRAIALPALDDSSAHQPLGESMVFVAVEAMSLGAIGLADEVRGEAREAVDLLRAHGVERVILLTGDQEAPARSVAAAVGVDEWRFGLLPEQKHAYVYALRAQGEGRGAKGQSPTVMMVGDGVNDAPALAAADVGVAMGAAGSDTAIETADVALMSDDLLKLPYALRLARATLRNIKTNVAVSLVLKGAFLVMAVSGGATLWMAVLADTGASVIVVANALRLLRAK